MKLSRDTNARLLSADACHELWLDDSAARTHSPPRMLTYDTVNGKQTVALNAGSGDTVHVYKESDGTRYVLTTNTSMGYAGLDIFGQDGETLGEKFIQDDHQFPEYGLPDGLDHAPYNIIKSLAQYIDYC